MKDKKTTKQTTKAETRETSRFDPSASLSTNIKNATGEIAHYLQRFDMDEEVENALGAALTALDDCAENAAVNRPFPANKAMPNVRLLKCSRVKDGKRFDNLYLQVNDGNPIAICLSFDNFKVKNMLLANATPCEIKNVTLVRETKESEF